MLRNSLIRSIINNLFKNKYFLASLGLIFLCNYIWFRFIRERLPRDIPFNLSLFNSVILLIVCCVYIYIILRYIKPKTSNSILAIKFYQSLSRLSIIFYSLDKTIKKNITINNKLEALLLLLITKLDALTIYDKKINKYIFYNLLSKIILVCLFLTDVFFLNKLNLTYKFIIITIIPLLINYFIYSIKDLQQQYLQILENYLIEITSEDEDLDSHYFMDPSMITYDNIVDNANDVKYKYLTIEHYIKLQATAIICNDTPYHYHCLHKSERKDLRSLSKKHNIIKINTTHYLNILIYVSIILESFEDVQKKPIIIKINIIILTLYLICWLYILICSLHTFHITDLEILFFQCFQDNIEPFSHTTLCDQPNEIQIEGHNTHKPPIGRITRFIDEKDSNGDPNAQYFVPTNKKVEITEQEKENYGKDFKVDPKTQTFVNQHLDKYE